MAAHEGLHEPLEKLKPATLELHRSLVSMIEELEAVDWYQQRADASAEPELSAILLHHRDEEIEHFAMVLEFVRRRDPKFDETLRTYLFKEGSIIDLEQVATAGEGGGASAENSSVSSEPPAAMTIGSLLGAQRPKGRS